MLHYSESDPSAVLCAPSVDSFQRIQDFQRDLNLLIRYDFIIVFRVVGSAHVGSSSQIEIASVYQLHNMRAQSV